MDGVNSAMTDLGLLSRGELQAMAEAAREVINCQRVLAKTGDNVVGEILRGAGTFYEWRHYPPGDVYDAEYHAQYYYHAHPETERATGEHGHFHTFLRPLGMPPGIAPAPVPDPQEHDGDNDALCHLVGISMDRAGLPIRLFTTNRWVTGETWYAADDVVRMLDCFVIDHARPSWPVNRWITALVRLFRPQIVELLHARDAEIRGRQAERPGVNVFEERELEVTSEMHVSVEDQIARIEIAQRRARRREAQSIREVG
jgi:hypothetical protein